MSDEKEKKITKQNIYQILMVFFAVVFFVSLVVLVVYWHNRQKNDDNLQAVQEIADVEPEDETEEAEEVAPQEKTIDFTALQEINEDIYAWIYVPGTLVNYPILQSKDGMDTDYYLTHNLDGSEGLPGCIYTQMANAKDFSDPDTVIYGHNMRNDSMFGSLHEYEDATFFQEHPYFYIYTPDQNLVYEIVVSYRSDNKLILDYYNYFEDEAVFAQYLSDIMNNTSSVSNVREGVTLDVEDRIVTLSTCIGNSDYRYLVIGKLLTEEEVDAIGQETVDAVQSEAESAIDSMSGADEASEEGEE